MANQAWPPQNPAMMNPSPNNPYPNNVAPVNPASAQSGGQGYGTPTGNNIPNGVPSPAMPPPNLANSGWAPPDQAPPNNSGPVSQAAAINNPNVPEATRRILEQMESISQKTASERQARDNAERQRQEMLKRQLRNEELGRANVVNPVYSQPNGANRWNGAPTSAPPNSNAPIVIGPPPNSGVPNQALWQATPDGQRPAYGTTPSMPNGQSSAMPNLARDSVSDAMPNGILIARPESMPNTLRESLPPTNTGSPLDAMPTWPPPGSLPVVVPNNSGSGSNSVPPPSNAGAWPNGFPPGMTDDPARAASRMGMNAGSGNPFPITPSPNSGATSAPNGLHSPNSLNNFGAPSGISPTTPPNWPAYSNPPNNGPLPGEPPAGSFGPGNFNTSANSPNPLLESSAQFALQDRLPQSEQFQTPSTFGHLPAGTTQTQPASFGANRGVGGRPASQFGSRNIPASDRNGDGERWVNGPVPGTQSVQTSTPSMQGYLATPAGENSLLEYERMIQATNAETNRIRQMMDEQRQLPPSENFRRSSTQTSSPNGTSRRQ